MSRESRLRYADIRHLVILLGTELSAVRLLGKLKERARYISDRTSLVVQTVKNLPAMQEIPGLGRSPGEGHGNPLQYSCLENPMDRGPLRAIVL